MSLKEAAARETYLKTLHDVVGDALKTARAETQRELDASAKETGARQVGVSLPDTDTDIATVSLTAGSAEARVTDADAFKAWVIENYSSEIERRFVTEVRAAFQEKVLGALTAAGGIEWADPDSGVIHEVPGVAIAPARARTHSLRFKTAGKDKVMQAWREGRLAEVALPELTAGGAE
jgi:hypothetical protein